MRIIIKNFKCWYAKELEIKDEGIILLSGRSGKGKSSILDAVFYCLFGEGKKIVSHGKNSAEVTIHVDDFTITRCNKPGRLHLISEQGEFEDDVAQSIINEHFGELFDVVSYVKQSGFNTFLKMSPTEKLEFIERALFQHTNIGELKKRTKEYITECDHNLVSCVSRIATLKETLQTLAPPEKVDFPFRVKKEDYEKVEKSENIKKRNSEIMLKKCKNDIHELTNLHNSLQIFLDSKKDKSLSLQKFDKEIEQIINESYILSKSFIGEEKISELKKIKEYLISRQKIDSLWTKILDEKCSFQTLRDDELDENKKVYDRLKEDVWQEYKREELEEKCEVNKQYIEDLKKIKKLKRDYKDISEEIVKEHKKRLEETKNKLSEIIKSVESLEKSKDILVCPHCENSVVYTEYGLEKSEKLHVPNVDQKVVQLEKERETVSKRIKIIESDYISSLKDFENSKTIKEEILKIEEQYEGLSEVIIEEIDDLIKDTLHEIENDESYIRKNINDEEKLKSLKNMIEKKTLSKSLQVMQKRIEDYEKEYRELNNVIGTNQYSEYTLTKVQKELEEGSELSNKLKNCEVQIKNYKNLKKSVLEALDKEEYSLKQKYSIEEVPEIEEIKRKIVETEKEIEQQQEKYDKSMTNILQIEKYKSYLKSKENYDSISEKIKNDEKEEKEFRNLLAGSTMLRDKISEAQSIAIQNFIQSLNAHTNLHLETFFRDDPMTVEIESFKEARNNKGPSKPQINLKIDYKGMDCDVSSLSGGERDRLDLALTLALAEIFGSRILLLDECISSLDYETSAHVLEGLKENYKGKSVVVVSHQANEGDFDEVINI